MNRKQKSAKISAKRAKAKKNKHTAPTIKKYISKADRAKMLAQEQAQAALNTTSKLETADDSQNSTLSTDKAD